MTDADFIRLALRLARRGCGTTSPNPMVGAVLVKNGKIIGRGWHRRAGKPHAEIEALRDAARHGKSARGATLYVTLEPCCTQGRTAPCTDAIISAGIGRLVAGVKDPNPAHSGRAFRILRQAGVRVVCLGDSIRPKTRANAPARGARIRVPGRAASPSLVAAECARLNESFNHWITRRTPFVTVKAAMTIDGKIATATGESKWITSRESRACAMRFRQESDAVLVGINTVLADNPRLSFRSGEGSRATGGEERENPRRRIILDSLARTPPGAKVLEAEPGHSTTIVVGPNAPRRRVEALARRALVLVAPLSGIRPGNRGSDASHARSSGREAKDQIDLRWLLRKLGEQNVTSLLVEGGGEVNASFLFEGLAHRVAFFYAPKILGGRCSRPAAGGDGAASLSEILDLRDIEWRRIGPDLSLTARVAAALPTGAAARRQ